LKAQLTKDPVLDLKDISTKKNSKKENLETSKSQKISQKESNKMSKKSKRKLCSAQHPDFEYYNDDDDYIEEDESKKLLSFSTEDETEDDLSDKEIANTLQDFHYTPSTSSNDIKTTDDLIEVNSSSPDVKILKPNTKSSSQKDEKDSETLSKTPAEEKNRSNSANKCYSKKYGY